ncbi:MAG: hypothetical protein F6K35_50405, partial [Okeania sp. SIO2H7]|nr:hypothetical protein [Okeania sp. SIO2H7]
QKIADVKGADSRECIEAWELVEDLEAEAVYMSNEPAPETTAFQKFCLEHPEILEVRHKVHA